MRQDLCYSYPIRMATHVLRTLEREVMFVRWSCGCIGIRHSDEECYVIKACDTNWDDMPLTFLQRDMTDVTDKPDGVRRVVPKPFIVLFPEEVRELLKDIQALMCDGFYFRKVKSLYGISDVKKDGQ